MVQDNIIKLATNILKLVGVKLKLTDIENINSNLFVLFYERILGNELENKIECPVTEKDDLHNIVAVIDKLSRNVLRISLSHINPMDVLNGKHSAVTHLLEIFQGLAECMQQEGKKEKNCRENRRQQTGHDKQKPRLIEGAENLRLKKRIDATDKQVDNLARATEQVLEMSSARQRFLHEQIGKLIGKRATGRIEECDDKTLQSDALLEYVNDHRDRMRMTDAAIGQISNRSANQQMRYSNSHVQHLSGGEVKETSKHVQEDDLTCITANDAYEVHHDDDEISCASNETYILESTTGRSDRKSSNVDLKEDLQMKDAWAQVNKDLIHKGYEKEFLDMLLDEGETLEIARKKHQNNAELLRKFSEHEICSRPLSAFDELVKFEDEHNSEDNQKNTKRKQSQRSFSERIQNRNSNFKSYVRPVVKHFGGHYDRKCIETGRNNSRRNIRYVTSSHDKETVTELLDSFPGLELSDETIRHLWSQAAKQASSIQQSHQYFISKLLPGEQKIEDARRRQKLLTLLLRKDALHQMRLQERKDEKRAQIATLSIKEKQRQQSARAKRYVEEFSNGMRARMVTKQAKEEQVFRSMFKEALKIQRDRINEMHRYAKDVKNEQLSSYQRDLESLETYYRDRFSMCADTLRKERKQINLQDKSQELALLKLKKEMRSKLENDIRVLQDSLVKSQHEIYFRELDAKQVLSDVARK